MRIPECSAWFYMTEGNKAFLLFKFGFPKITESLIVYEGK